MFIGFCLFLRKREGGKDEGGKGGREGGRKR